MFISAEIEIAATPEECRKVFLDWENWPKIGTDVIRSIERKSKDKAGPPEKGEKLKVDMGGSATEFTVLDNSPNEFIWRFDKFFIISGIHSYKFEPSTVTPGHTKFINSENFIRASVVIMRLFPIQKSFTEFCQQFKARVELVKQESATA